MAGLVITACDRPSQSLCSLNRRINGESSSQLQTIYHIWSLWWYIKENDPLPFSSRQTQLDKGLYNTNQHHCFEPHNKCGDSDKFCLPSSHQSSVRFSGRRVAGALFYWQPVRRKRVLQSLARRHWPELEEGDWEDPGPAGLCQAFWSASSGQAKPSAWSVGEKMVLPMW